MVDLSPPYLNHSNTFCPTNTRLRSRKSPPASNHRDIFSRTTSFATRGSPRDTRKSSSGSISRETGDYTGRICSRCWSVCKGTSWWRGVVKSWFWRQGSVRGVLEVESSYPACKGISGGYASCKSYQRLIEANKEDRVQTRRPHRDGMRRVYA